ncbi:MAG: alpha-hydroxy-acid oxidizing protein [Saprospiraceae bacterium]
MLSLQRQREIYLNGLAGNTSKTPFSFEGLKKKAMQSLPREAFAYLSGGAGHETTMLNNRRALDEVKIHPHMLGGVQEVSMQLKWREHTLPAPFMSAPIGVLELAHNDGDLLVAKVVAPPGIPMIISSQASFPITEIHSDLIKHPWKNT